MRRAVYCLLGLLAALTTVEARTKDGQTGYRIFQRKRHQINNVDLPITNYGQFGMSDAGSAGTYFPKGSGEPYIFGAGLWIGAIKGNDTLVSVGYNTVGGNEDFIPGPDDPVHIWDQYANHNSHPEDRIFMSTDATDLADWRAGINDWLPRDPSGNPIILSHQDFRCEYNDLCDSLHLWERGTKPIGLSVRQFSFAWNAPINGNIVFILYEFKNASSDTIRQLYVGHAADNDVGNADDDLVGCDVGRSLGYTYTLNKEANWTSTPPYYVGVRFLLGPKADTTVAVKRSPYLPDTVIHAGEHLPLTAFTRCTRDYDADNEIKRYLMLAGYNIESKQYDPWQGVVDIVPADKRMVMGCGPFVLAPGETDTFLIAVMFSNGNTGGLSYLQSEGDIAKIMFDNNWAFPSPPPNPSLTAVPGEGQVALFWDNSAELVPDPFYKVMDEQGDTLYRKFDFEGYRLWRSRSGLADDWTELAEWDIANDITLLPGDVYLPGIGNVGGTKSNNQGLWYSYVDNDVYNGVTYYYAITTYDFNTPGDPNNPNQDVWKSLESGYFPATCTPRAEAGNLISDTATTPFRTRGATNTVSSLTAKIDAPIGITGDSYRLVFGRIVLGNEDRPAYTYTVYDDTKKRSVVGTSIEVPVAMKYVVVQNDTIERLWDAQFSTPVFDGLELAGRITVNPDSLLLPDSVTTTASYVDNGKVRVKEFFVPSTAEKNFTTPEAKKWAYHGGARIEIRWKYLNGHSDTLTCDVWDITNNIRLEPDTTIGDGWCFGPHMPFGAPKLYLNQGNVAIWFYVAGVRYEFNNGQRIDWPTGIKAGDVWTIYSSAPDLVPCAGNEFSVATTKFHYAAESKLELVRVVPNPYVVRAVWDRSRDYRKIMFTHLPDSCTIRIFNLSGDLIRIINHPAPGAKNTAELGGMESWDMLTKNDQWAASGIYLYQVTTPNGQTKLGKFAIIR
jgi:hypothetical protein